MIPLAGLSYLYGLAIKIRIKACEKKTKKELPGFVLSIGNLTVGGTGKTPANGNDREWAKKEGYRPAILSRGYAATTGQNPRGIRRTASLLYAGGGWDEPYLLSKKLEGVPVVLSRAAMKRASLRLSGTGRTSSS